MALGDIDLGGENLTVNTIKVGATAPGKAGTATFGGNLSLVAGTAAAAPLTLAAGTNLTTAAAGAVEFDGTAFYATSVASSRQQLDAEQYVIASANSATYNNTGLDTATTPTAVFTTAMGGSAAGTITLVAGKTYLFEGIYNLTNTGTTSHTWATTFGGTATFSAGSSYQVFGNSSGTANSAATGGLSGFTTALATPITVTAASTSATEQVTVELVGTVIVNAGRTFIPQIQAS